MNKLLITTLLAISTLCIVTTTFADDWRYSPYQEKWNNGNGGSCYYNQWQQKWVCN